MLQLFHMDVVKVDLDIAYVAMVIRACFKSMIKVFHLFQTYIVNASFVCFKSRSGVAQVAMDTGGWRTAACRNRLVLLQGHH
jgi:hypothetical protein